MNTYRVIYQRHAVERMAQRGLSEEDVMHVLLAGETIYEMRHLQAGGNPARNHHHDA